jgi:hypothetical protein
VYDIYGESDPSNSSTVTVSAPAPSCNAPENLMAESLGNDVSLSWDAPEGEVGWFGHNDGMIVTAIGTNAAAEFSVAARFGQEELANYNGMSLSKVRFVHNEPTASYQVVVWTAEPGGSPVVIDMSDWMDGAEIPANEWFEYELDESITIDWTQELWFGYNIDTPVGYPAACDGGPAVTGYGDLLTFDGDFISMNAAYGLNYNWMIDGFADYADGRSIASMAPINVEYSAPATTSEPVEHRLPTPIVINTPSDRDMTNYVVYRNGEAEDTLGVGETTYNDRNLEWGDYNYFVTALYINEECGESEPSNTVEVTHFNAAPDAVMLLSPEDGLGISVDSTNLDEEVAFIWTASVDPDGDEIGYALQLWSEDASINYPLNSLVNSGFEVSYQVEESNDLWYLPEYWEAYPHQNNQAVAFTGDPMHNSEETFEAFDGDASLKLWGLYEGENTENNIFQTWSDGSLEPGTRFHVGAYLYSHHDDWIGQGGNSFVLFAKYYTEEMGWIGMHTSDPFSGQESADVWHWREVWCTVPEGASIVQVGGMLVQPSNDDHGGVYIDELAMHIPLTLSGQFISYGDLAAPLLDAEVYETTYDWTVWAMDDFNWTEASNGPRSLTVDATALEVVPNITFGITSSGGLPGDIATVSVWAELPDDYEMYSYQMSVAGFGGDQMSFLDADTIGSITPTGWMFTYNEDDSESVVITAGAGAEPVTDSGNLFNLSFILSGDAGTSEFVDLFITDALLNEDDDATYNTEPGGIMVLSYGDVTMNGSVTAFDASVILQYVVGSVELDDAQVAAGDVTLDESLSALDAAIILQFTVGIVDDLPYDSDMNLAAGGDVMISGGSVSPGDVFQMPILLDGGDNVRSYELEFSYDPEVLVYQSLNWDESVSGMTILDNQEDGIIRVGAAGLGEIESGSVVLGYVEFELVDTFDEYETTVTMSRSRLNEKAMVIDGSTAIYTNALLVIDEWGHGGVPEVYALQQNFPNPFNPVTQIRYQLPEESIVTIQIYDIMGRVVRSLVSGQKELTGYHQVSWDGTNNHGDGVSAGMYLYVIQAGKFRNTRKMVFMK